MRVDGAGGMSERMLSGIVVWVVIPQGARG